MKKKSFKVDLTKIDGGGDFPCPKCGTMISPEDETEEVYTIIETYIGEEDNLESMVIQCNKCNSTINLDGFGSLLEEEETHVEISEASPESKSGYRTHHTISLEGRQVGHMVVEYAQKEDVKAFKRIKRLRVGDPFKSTITVESTELEKTDFQEIAKRIKLRFKGLKNHDIYLLEIREGRRQIIGRASDL